jgi:phage terminase small subunit
MPKLKNVNHELFCNLYATQTEFFGNGTQSYIEAYDVDLTKKGAYASARTMAYKLLTKVDILNRIDELLESAVLNNQFIDKQLAFLITQHADFSSKMKAISEYNKLKQRITEKKKVEITGLDKLLQEITDTENNPVNE